MHNVRILDVFVLRTPWQQGEGESLPGRVSILLNASAAVRCRSGRELGDAEIFGVRVRILDFRERGFVFWAPFQVKRPLADQMLNFN
ncbi:MAG: hypothetical protein ACI9R7_000877 [Lysobacterales bacterium]|jgi:hypothetical protein